jgi:hypothetical protein
MSASEDQGGMSAEAKPQRFVVGIPPAASVFAYGALLPMAVGVVLIASNGIGSLGRADVTTGFLAYAALLLAFHAGTRFGHALRVTGVTVAVIASGAPLVAAFVSLWLPDRLAAGLLALAFAAQGAWDVWSADRARLTAWYGRLRLRTAPVAVLLLVAAVVLLSSEG